MDEDYAEADDLIPTEAEAAFDEDEPTLYSADETGEDGDDLMDRLVATADTLDGASAETPSRAARPCSSPSRRPTKRPCPRMLTRTDGELNTPEASRRRAALAQLKAAVAATEAARRLGEGQDSKEEAEDAFRDDLRQVVRPRRATRTDADGEGRSERPRPAPLKLAGAAQRIDMPRSEASSDDTPVRPRRVTVEDIVAEQGTATDSDGSGFAEFARASGAHGLPELLEAAAAYTSFVEGLDDFSRPQLISKVREMAAAPYSREDELRSFGLLLREGRILKVRTVSSRCPKTRGSTRSAWRAEPPTVRRDRPPSGACFRFGRRNPATPHFRSSILSRPAPNWPHDNRDPLSSPDRTRPLEDGNPPRPRDGAFRLRAGRIRQPCPT